MFHARHGRDSRSFTSSWRAVSRRKDNCSSSFWMGSLKPSDRASPQTTSPPEILSVAERLTRKAYTPNNVPCGPHRIRDLYTKLCFRGIKTVVDNAENRAAVATKAASEALNEELANAFIAYANANKEVQRTGDLLLQILALEL